MKPKIRISLQGGRADLHRAPVKDLVLLLEEVQDLVLDLGRQLFGADAPEKVIEQSCRLEVVGLSLTSVSPELELAFDADEQPNHVGRRAMEAACVTLAALRDPTGYVGFVPAPGAVDRIEAMSGLLERGYARIEVAYVQDGRSVTGVLDHELRARLLSQEAASVGVESVTIRGVLYSLEDRPSETREKKTFSGRLLDDAGEVWTARFRQEQVDLARDLWRKVIELSGNARYSRTRGPVLHVETGKVIDTPDWQQALVRYRGAWRDVYRGRSFEQIVSDLR
jgi:hypothetical protein